MLIFHELAPSPNNTKVRMALRFKQIPFEVKPVAGRERAAVLQVSRQELTPVIEDKGIVLNDSEAILQYLDANYRDTPRLFPPDRAGRRACDAWKDELDEKVATTWWPVFAFALGFRDELTDEARDAYRSALGWLQDELKDGHFQDPAWPICDLRVAEWATYGLPSPAFVERVGAIGKFRDATGIEPGAFPQLEAFLAPWNERLS